MEKEGAEDEVRKQHPAGLAARAAGPSPSITRRKVKEWNPCASPLQACSTADRRKSQEWSSDAKSAIAIQEINEDGNSTGVEETTEAVLEVDEDGNKSVNEYLIIKTIGKGSFAKVKLCLNTKDNELYAMKVCHKAILAKRRRGLGNALDHIWREVDILKHLQHPNVVALKHIINDPQSLHLYIVFEYLELGPVMRDLDGTPLEMDLTRSYFCDVLQGLRYLHSRNVVHCDLKPDNLLVSAEGKAKIIDFGSSRYVGTESMMAASEGLVCHEMLEGTPAFMAPELCSSAYSYEEASKFPRDVWALGVCLYCFVTGRLPFLADNVMEMYDKIRNDEPSFDEIADAGLVSLLRGALDKDPTRRLTLAQIQEHPWVLESAAQVADDFG